MHRRTVSRSGIARSIFRVSRVRFDDPRDAAFFMHSRNERVAKALCGRGHVSAEAGTQALASAHASGKLVESALELTSLSDTALLSILADVFGVPAIDLNEYYLERDVVERIPRAFALARLVIAVNHRPEDRTLVVAMPNPADIDVIDTLRFVTGLQIELFVATETSVLDAIFRSYPLVS